MAESSQPSERPPKDPVRIVYHTENRTFARLFKERSLDQVKDVVRRKLGLGQEIDVSLKQMGPDALLDLDDDDDFQAFRVLLRSSVSVDIQVIVGRSQGASVPPPVAPQPREQPSAAAPVTLPSSSSKESHSQASARPEAASVAEPSTTTKKTLEPSARKRKVSFGDTPVATPDKPTERRTQSKPVAATPVSSAQAAETPAATKSTEPPKKKQKKDIVKAKDAQPTEGVESPTAKKPKVKKSAASDRGTEAAPSVSKSGESSELPAKKSGKRKKDDGSLPKKASSLPDPDGMDQPVSQPNPMNDTSVQLPSERRIRSGAKGGVSKTRQGEKKIGVCATIPRTSASASVQSEVAAAILASYLSQGSELVLPPPPVKRKSVKRDTKKSSASSGASLSRSTAANASYSGTPNVPTEPGHEQAVAINEILPQTREPKCPICLGEPFHIRYRCPTVLKGADAIRKRLEEVKKLNAGEQQSLIKELEGLLRDTEVTSESPSNAPPLHEVQSQEALQPLDASISRTPNIPSNSNLSEVTVENRDEGSSSESSDEMSDGGNKPNKELPASFKRKIPDNQPSPSNDDLEAVIRGPALRRQSILRVLDHIGLEEDREEQICRRSSRLSKKRVAKNSESEEDDMYSDLEEDEDEIGLEEDREEQICRRSSRLSKKRVASSSETEEEESVSPSPSFPAQDNPGASLQGSNSPVEKSKSTEHRGHDVVMGDCVDPPVLRGQDDDSSEETHVGSEGRMEVDDTVEKKGVATIVEERLSSSPSKASFSEPLDGPNNEPQESGETEVGPTANGDGSTPAASNVPGEAEADPIEPADDLEPPTTSRTSNSDPIEALANDTGSLFTGIDQSTPKPGVTKRIKTRDGRILDDEAEHPVLVEQLATSTSEGVTPLPTKGKPRRKVTETPASQEQESTRRRTRSSSILLSTTPTAATLLKHRAKVGAQSAKTPAKRSEQRTDGSQISTKDDRARNAVRIAPSPSLANWETLAELSSPSLQLDESVHIDELMSSSQPEDNAIVGRLGAKEKNSTPAQKERLFDLSSSQIPFPYSQYKSKPAPKLLNGKEKEAATDSGSEQEAKMTKIKAAYRPLSQLASQAVLFSPSLPTATNKSVAGTKAKKPADKDSSSSSSSSDEDEANKSVHIPRGRRAGAKMETRKRKSLLSMD